MSEVFGPDGHATVDSLADHAEGITAPQPAAALESHLAGCAECAETLAQLRGVSILLATAPPEPIPDAVAARIEAAIARQVDADREPVLVPARQSGHRARPSLLRRLAPFVAGAAVIAGIAVGVTNQSTSSSSRSASSLSSGEGSAAKSPSSPDRMTQTLTQAFTTENLASQMTRLLAATPASAAENPEVAPNNAPQNEGGCLLASLSSAKPLLTVNGTYNDTQAKIIAYPRTGDPAHADVYAVKEPCSGRPDVLAKVVAAR